MPHRFYILFLVLLLSRQLHSQDSKQYSFTHYGPSNGLASNETVSAKQDETGYIWIGTNNGLQRFDGSRYITFRNQKNDTTSIPHNRVQQLLFDKQKKLWLMTGDGKVGVFDTKSFTYHEVSVKLREEGGKIGERGLIQDEAGNLFIIYAHRELVMLNKERTQFSREFNFIPVPDDGKTLSFAHQPGTSNYWIGRTDGFLVYNSQTRQLSHPGGNNPGNPLAERLGKLEFPHNLFFDKQNRLWFDCWIGGAPKIFLYDLAKKELILDTYPLNIGDYHETRGYLQQKDGTIWIRGLGVFAKYLEKEKKFQKVENIYHNEQSISFEIIFDFFEDREESIWLATSNNGLYRFAPASQFFTNIPHINRMNNTPGKGSVMSFFQTRKGTLLAGAWSDGLYQYDKDLNPIPVNIKGFDEKLSPFMWCMYPSRDSDFVWMGSQPGIYHVNQVDRSSKYYNPPALKNRTIRQIAEDRFGNLWIGTQSIGLFKWTAAKGKKKFEEGISYFPGVPHGQILKIFIDNKGIVWVGTNGYGVYAIDPATDKIITHLGIDEPAEKRLLAISASAITQYDDSTIVIGSGGLLFYNTRQQKLSRSIPTPSSIPGSISAIEKDRQGYVWISSTSGIIRVNPRNGIFIHFDRIDGIANDRFIVAASYVLPDGRIAFGADNQIVLFNPEEVTINNPSPDIAITGIKVMSKPLQVDSLLKSGTIELNADENSLTIEFSGLSYNSTYIISYKLEDIDKEWKMADNTNQAIYTYLPAGKYTFLVRSEDAEGNIGKNITRLSIIVRPHFWKTWWFYSLLVLLAIVVLYWIDRERVSRLKDLQKVRTEIANNLHNDVTTTLSHINLLGEMAKIKADKDINRSKEYIDQISSKSHNMIIAMDDILWSIDPENDSMEKTLLRMMEFTDALKQRYGAAIELVVDKKIRSLKLDMKVRNEFFLIFKEGLRMIVQYAGGKDTLINIDFFRNKLSLKLQDATARMDTQIDEIERCIKEINTRSEIISAEADIQYDKNGIAIILLIPAK